MNSRATSGNGVTLVVLAGGSPSELSRCLLSAAPAVERIFALIDSRADSECAQVVRLYGGQALVHEWPGRFDVAANRLASYVQTPWTLRLDCDEWFGSSPAESLSRMCAQDRAFGYRLMVRTAHNDSLYLSQTLRLWRTNPRLAYEGAAHEAFSSASLRACAEGRTIYNSDLTINHFSFSQQSLSDKVNRNLSLLRKFPSHSGNLHFQILEILGELQVERSVPRQLEELVSKLLFSDSPPDARNFADLLAAVLGAHIDMVSQQTVDQALKRAPLWYPNNPKVLWNCARQQLIRGNPEGAAYHLHRIGAARRDGRLDLASPTEQRMLGSGLHLGLHTCYRRLGHARTSERFLALSKLEAEREDAVFARFDERRSGGTPAPPCRRVGAPEAQIPV